MKRQCSMLLLDRADAAAPRLPGMTMQRFAGFSAVVTGAASGLGREVVRGLAREGAARIALIDRDAEGLAALAGEIGPAALPLAADVSEEAAMAAAFARVAPWGGAEVLVTAAGILGPVTDVASCSPANWDRLFAVNVRGTYLALHFGVPELRRRGSGGAIVTFASTAGIAGSATLGPYSATKGAVVMMTKSLALSLAAEGIRVNCVCPGSIETPMLEANLSAGPDPAARTAEYRARHPMNRFGKAQEVAEAVLFLASRQASYMTGVALPVDGGRLA
jgi:NAD(P)-dependent dehydrogenase (short-subunit alcohol dehydrogenase family)